MQSIALFANTGKAEAITWTEITARRLLAEGVAVMIDPVLAEYLADEVVEQCSVRKPSEYEKLVDMVITFGGDGTLLSAAHLLIGTDIPIMGVNVGRLGFLAEFPVSNMEETIMEVVKGDYRIVDRSTMTVTVNDKQFFALNEVLIERSAAAKMIAVRAFVNEHHVADYRSDGVIVTTPTGSTAYSLAAGGPIIAPSAQVICITPISPHTLTLRPLIINDSSVVRFELPFDGTEAQIVSDGKIVATIVTGGVVSIEKSEFMLKLIKRADSTYYDLLREKLLWSADATKPPKKNSE